MTDHLRNLAKALGALVAIVVAVALNVWAHDVLHFFQPSEADKLCAYICEEVSDYQVVNNACFCCEVHPSSEYLQCEEVIW